MQKEIIYNSICGYYDQSIIHVHRDKNYINEFEEGRECDRMYEKIYQARLSLGKKLGDYEDVDVEIIIDCMNRISKILSMKMYDYGSKEKQDTF